MRIDTDLPLKKLFALRAADLLVLTGDRGARVETTDAVEVAATARRADFVLTLRGRAGAYLRHVEFQSDCPPGLARRCFEYNTRLHLHSGLPVLTTVVFLKPPGPGGRPVYEVRLGRRVLHRWRFDWIKLWEIEARATLERGSLGAAVLVPLMRASSWELVQAAAERIQAEAPHAQQPDLLSALTVFAGVRYADQDLSRLRGRVMVLEGSSAWKWLRREVERKVRADFKAKLAKGERLRLAEGERLGLAEGERLGLAEGERLGLAKGELRGARALCLELVNAFQPTLATQARPVIDACDDAARLKEWSVNAPRLDGTAFARLLGLPRRRGAGGGASVRVRRRAPVPARRSRS